MCACRLSFIGDDSITACSPYDARAARRVHLIHVDLYEREVAGRAPEPKPEPATGHRNPPAFTKGTSHQTPYGALVTVKLSMCMPHVSVML